MGLPTRGIVTDATPRVAVRWDDGSVSAYPDVMAAIDYRIPISLALNWNYIRPEGSVWHWSQLESNNKFTVTQVQAIQRRCLREDVPFTVLQHTNTNWSQDSLSAYTWDMFLAELNTDAIAEALGGLRPITYIQPGDGQIDAVQRHWQTVRAALLETGHQFAIGLSAYIDETTGGDGAPFTHNNTINALYQNSGAVQTLLTMRPGMVREPFNIPGGWTMDLGNTLVTRGVPGDPDSLDPISNEPAWLLGEDNGRGAVDGSATSDWERTWAFKYSSRLACGSSFIVALHSEARTNEVALTLTDGSGNVARPRHFSAKHVFATLRALADAGLIVLCTVDEWCQYIYSDYAPGVDLVANPTSAIPSRTIGDLAGGDVPVLAGCGRSIVGYNAFPNTSQMQFSLPADSDGDQLYNEPFNLDTYIGSQVTGVRGRQGGFKLRPTESTAINAGVKLAWSNLGPGRYRLVIDVEVTGGAVAVGNFAAVGARWRDKPSALLTDPDVRQNHSQIEYAPVFAMLDTLSWTPDPNEPTTLELPFLLPRDNVPALAAVRANEAVGTIVNGGTWQFSADSTAVTVTGARVGDRVLVMAEEDLQGCGIVGEVTAPDTVDVTISNNTGGNVTLTTGDYVVLVEKDPRHGYRTLDDVGVSSDWNYSVQLTLDKYSLSQALISNIRLLYYPLP